MEKIKSILNTLLNSVSLSGQEIFADKAILEIAKGEFDKVDTDNMGSFVLLKKSNKSGVKKLLIDAHYDTVGLMVTKISDNGFLSFTQVGGLDVNVLPSCEVTVHGTKDVYGIITSTPPHLKKGGSKSPKMDSLAIDTGFKKEDLEGIIDIGTPVTFMQKIDYIANDFVTASGLDDKACLAAILDAVIKMDRDKMEYDIYVTASAQEETGRCGVARVAFGIEPDIAIVTDVNFANTDTEISFECIEAGKGASIDVSAITQRSLTRAVMKHLTSEEIPYQVVCEPSYTGTNADALSISGNGIPTLLASIPLKSMHTPSETVSLRDIKSLSDILVSIAYKQF